MSGERGRTDGFFSRVGNRVPAGGVNLEGADKVRKGCQGAQTGLANENRAVVRRACLPEEGTAESPPLLLHLETRWLLGCDVMWEKFYAVVC
jgi:hypothetical protein